jgi:hypothetical protein
MPFSSDSGFYLNIRLPCGKMINGSVGGMKNYKMQFRLHKKVCDTCCDVRLDEISLNAEGHHFQTKLEGYKSVGALSSIIHKY